MSNFNPFWNTEGGGAGAGSQGAGSPSAAGGGQGGSQGVGSAASQAAAAVALSDDSRIKVGDKEYSFSEYRTHLQNEAGTKTRQEVEAGIRKLAQTLQQQQRQQRPQQQQQQHVDPLAGIRENPILSGQQLEQALNGTLGPVAQQVAQLQQQNQQLVAAFKKMQAGVGGIAKERNSAARAERIAQAITGIGVEGIDPKEAILNELAADVLDAWEFDKPEEYPAMVQKRFNDLRKMFRALDKKELEAAKTKRFVRPGGSASPSGAARFDPRNAAKHAADILFGQQGANAT